MEIIMPFKDKQKRYEAINKSRAKKPALYRQLNLNNQRKRQRRGYMLERLYGITMAEYEQMLHEQQGNCLTCQKPGGLTVSGRCDLYVDHCHKTGKVRGILCARCNMLAGYWDQENGEQLIKAVGEYVKKHS